MRFTDTLIEDYIDDSHELQLSDTWLDKLKKITDLNTCHNRYSEYMINYNKLRVIFTPEEITAAREAEDEFIKTADRQISSTASIVKATSKGYIVTVRYNDKQVVLLLPDFYFITKYNPVPYINKLNPGYSVEYFINNYDSLDPNSELYRAIRFHESNIPLRYADKKHGPKRVGTFYKTYLCETILTDLFGLTKLTDQSFLRKGSGDKKPDFTYTENGITKHAEAKMNMTIDAALAACKKVNMTPFPNKIFLLNGSILTIYTIEAEKVIASETYLQPINLPDLSYLPEEYK